MSRSWPVSRDAFRLRLLAPLTLSVGGAVLAGVSRASAQAVPILCLPPEAPLTALPDAVLTEYRAEISVENWGAVG